MKAIAILSDNPKFKKLDAESDKQIDKANEEINKLVKEHKTKTFNQYWDSIYEFLTDEGIYPKGTNFKKIKIHIKDGVLYELNKEDVDKVMFEDFPVLEKLKQLKQDLEGVQKKASKKKTIKKKQ